MTLASALHVALLGLSVVVTTTLAGYGWRHRAEHGATAFVGLMLSFSVYSGTHLVGLLTFDPAWRLLWEYLQWTGTAVIPVFWLLFALAYTGHDGVIDRRSVAALSLVPAVTVVLTWTNGVHGLMWTENTVVVVDGLALLAQPFGPWFWVYTVFMYAAVGVGGALLLRLVWFSDHLYTDQAVLMVLGVTAPIAASGLTVLGVTPIRSPALDLTPYSFVVTGVAFGYALFRHRLFDLVPATRQLGRNAVLHHLEDGVVIVDTARQVLYLNPTAAELFDCEPADVLGRPVRSLVDESAIDFDTEDALAEVDLGEGVYEVRTSPIQDRHGRLTGHTLVVHDITARKRRERQLARQHDRLERLDDLNAAVRGVHRALVNASDAAEIKRAVCDHLVETGLYRTACAADLATWNGAADCWTVAGDGADADVPPELAVELSLDPDGATSLPDSLDGEWTVVPLVYGPTVYGALALRATDTGRDGPPITEREREVLAELGQLIGHALNAAQNRRLLRADSVVELEFCSRDTEGTLLGAATAADCAFDLQGIVPNAADGHLAYLRTDAEPAAATDALAAGHVRTVREDEETLIEWGVPDGSVLATLVDQGAHVTELRAADGTTTAVAEVASDADVRDVVDRVTTAFPGTTLDAKRIRERPPARSLALSRGTTAELTDRQREVLETAYRAGYFDWPRQSTAEEVADSLGIAAPTVHAHLRKAEGKLFDELFDRSHE